MEKNPINEKEVLDLLEQVSDGGVRWSHVQGYVWLRDIFLPALAFAEENLPFEKEMIGECYYVLGDIHDFNHAPKVAIRAYFKALEYIPDMGEAYREIASMYDSIGEYKKAWEYINKAKELSPDDSWVAMKLEWMQPSEEPGEPLYSKDDPVLQCNELLAELRTLEALDLVQGRKDVELLKATARCLGALGYNQQYLEAWAKILDTEGEFEISWSDWFYMPEAVENNIAIWKILFNLTDRIKISSNFPFYSSLEASELYSRMSLSEKRKLRIRYIIAEICSDITVLRQLHAQYPEWEELEETLRQLESH